MLYGGVLALLPAAYLAVAVLRVLHGGEPTDFLGFYAAAMQALGGDAAGAWNPDLHHAVQQAVTPSGHLPYFYPPPFLLLTTPLALLPYTPAYGAWMLVTFGLCLQVLLRYRAGPWPALAAICLFAPASVLTVATGQTAFLMTALFASAGLLLDRQAMPAGFIVAGLAIKPQLGLVVLPALIAARRWRVIAFAAVAGGLGVLVSGIGLGWASWPAFLSGLSHATAALQRGEIQLWQVQSIYGLTRLAGAPQGLAMAAQVLVGGAAVLVVVRLAARRPGGAAEVSAMAAAAPLTTPYVFASDLTILLLPVVWMLSVARRDGFLAWEKLALLAGIVVPGVSAYLGQRFGVNIGPVAPLILLASVLRRTAAMPRQSPPGPGAPTVIDLAAKGADDLPPRKSGSIFPA